MAAYGRLKTAWTVMAVGFACWLLGETLWAYYEVIAGQKPSPSWADAAYLAYYPCVCFALLLFPSARSWRSQAQTVLDAVVVTGSFFLISWLTVLRPIWQSQAENKTEFVVSVAYPVGDMLVMTVGLLVLVRAAPGLRRTLTLLVLGLMAAALADSLWLYDSQNASYSADTLNNVLYAANALLIIVALVAGYRAQPGGPVGAMSFGWLSRSLPIVPLALAAVFVGLAHPDVVTEGPVVGTGLLVIVSLVARQMLEAAELGKRERQIRTLADRLFGELAATTKYVASILPGAWTGRCGCGRAISRLRRSVAIRSGICGSMTTT